MLLTYAPQKQKYTQQPSPPNLNPFLTQLPGYKPGYVSTIESLTVGPCLAENLLPTDLTEPPRLQVILQDQLSDTADLGVHGRARVHMPINSF